MIGFETKRLFLRRFLPEDWRDLFEYLSDPEVVKHEPYGVFSESESRQEALRRGNSEQFWAVCLKDSNKVIGNIFFNQRQPTKLDTWELGYVFNRVYQGKGYATESCEGIIRFGFEQRGAHRIVAHCNPQNIPSWRLLERLGLRREGHFRSNVFFWRDEFGNPVWNDTYQYGILREEWMQGPLRG